MNDGARSCSRKWVIALCLLALFGACSTEEAKRKAAGNVRFKHGDIDGAIVEYRAAIAANERDANAHTLLGNALFEKERYPEATAEYERALALDPRARAAALGLVAADLRAGRTDHAKRLLTDLTSREPRDAEAQSALGKLDYATGDLDGAERHLREALVYVQNDPAALYALGLVLANKPSKTEREQATAIFDRLEAQTPGKAYAPYGRAVLAARDGDTEAALKWLAVALDRGVDDLTEVERDKSFAALRDTARFQALLSAARGRAPPKKGSGGP
jgi:tetratricopeptide (TPR) repeat protein